MLPSERFSKLSIGCAFYICLNPRSLPPKGLEQIVQLGICITLRVSLTPQGLDPNCAQNSPKEVKKAAENVPALVSLQSVPALVSLLILSDKLFQKTPSLTPLPGPI